MDNSHTNKLAPGTLDVRSHNRDAWDREVQAGNQWTVPVSPESIQAARQGDWQIVLTPLIPVPSEWFPQPLAGKNVLCLASAGGQQGPILAAAGAHVTVLDNSPAQLDRDRMVAMRDHLDMQVIEGDMRDLSAFGDESFDLVFHPVSNLFVPDIQPVWNETFRVLRRGGILLSGFVNPAVFIFDLNAEEHEGSLKARHSIPYSDLTSLTKEELKDSLSKGEPLEFGHSLDSQIGGQLRAGFVLTGFFEDKSPDMLLSKYMPTMIATRVIKP
jgi:SAM-dependent methyltransferase